MDDRKGGENNERKDSREYGRSGIFRRRSKRRTDSGSHNEGYVVFGNNSNSDGRGDVGNRHEVVQEYKGVHGQPGGDRADHGDEGGQGKVVNRGVNW